MTSTEYFGIKSLNFDQQKKPVSQLTNELFEMFYVVRFIRRLRYILPGKPLRMIHSRCKVPDR